MSRRLGSLQLSNNGVQASGHHEVYAEVGRVKLLMRARDT